MTIPSDSQIRIWQKRYKKAKEGRLSAVHLAVDDKDAPFAVVDFWDKTDTISWFPDSIYSNQIRSLEFLEFDRSVWNRYRL